MAKRGGTKHLKRIASAKAVPITDKKAHTWMTRPAPGPHPAKHAIPLGVFARDVLKLAPTLRECRRILASRMLEVDGRVRTDEKFPVGLMDVVSFPKSGRHIRLTVDSKGRLSPRDIEKGQASRKILRVVRKHTVPGGKLNLTFHDGRNLLSDNHVRVGDSVVVSIPKVKMESHLKREKGARCLVMEGKHAGSIVQLKEIIERKGGKPSEAVVQGGSAEFITVAKYLFVVDEAFGGKG
jgi:small subunit ribosomal protein S4e